MSITENCPFCGEDDIHAVYDEVDGHLEHYVECDHCGARGPIAPNRQQAINEWDTCGVKDRD